MPLRIEIYHNQTEPDHWFGYRPGHLLEKVFSYELDDPHPGGIVACDHAWIIGNLDQGAAAKDSYEEFLVDGYRNKQLRSLSVGDVVSVGGQFFSVAVVGWTPITRPPQ